MNNGNSRVLMSFLPWPGTSMGIAAGVFQDVDADAYSMFLPDYITSPSTGFLVACSGVVGAVLCSMLSHWVHVSSRRSRTECKGVSLLDVCVCGWVGVCGVCVCLCVQGTR